MTITCVQKTKGPCKVTQQKISLTNVNKPFCKVTKVTVSEVSLMMLWGKLHHEVPETNGFMFFKF